MNRRIKLMVYRRVNSWCISIQCVLLASLIEPDTGFWREGSTFLQRSPLTTFIPSPPDSCFERTQRGTISRSCGRFRVIEQAAVIRRYRAALRSNNHTRERTEYRWNALIQPVYRQSFGLGRRTDIRLKASMKYTKKKPTKF